MIKVFIPEIKGRVKSNIRGFWYSKENKKTYYDYLKVIDYKCNYGLNGKRALKFYDYCEGLKSKYNQESIFVINRSNHGILYFNKSNKQYLSMRIYAEVKPEALKQEIKQALRFYGGITIYKEGKKYFKEIFYKRG
jgi:hypothetical protein